MIHRSTSSIHRSAAFAAVALGTLLVAAPLSAQDVIDPVDPLEDQALQQEAQAQFEQSLQTFKEAFHAAVQEAAGGGAKREKNLARAEVLLEKIGGLTETVTQHAETDQTLAGYSAEQLGPVLGAHVDWVRARLRLAEGDTAGAESLAAKLGLIHDWWIIGPFDNERGRGFNVPQPPEAGIDLTASYDGKERQVAWRKIPVRERLGLVNFNAMLRPNNQACAYAVAFVKSESAQAATVRLGSDEAVRAWWNGASVLERDIRRRLGFDQDVVGVTLNEGWNTVLVKVHDQTGAWGFRARLTAPDGAPLSGITWAASDEDATAAAGAGTAATPFDGAISGGAKGYYDALGEGNEGKSARDLFHLGYLHLQRGFDSIADRKAENLLKQASELDPDNAIFKFHYAEAASPPTEMSVEKEENRQKRAREATLEMEPGYAVAYHALAGYYTSSLVNLERAEQFLRKALEINPNYLEARLDLSRVLQRRGLTAAAEKERRAVLDSPAFSSRERHARAAARELERQGRGREAIDAWKHVLSMDARSNDVRRKVAELAGKALERDDAMVVLAAITGANPYDTRALTRRAELLEGLSDYDAAAEGYRTALHIAPEDDKLLQALARVQLKAGDQDGALVTMREALRVNPKLQNVERYVEFLDPGAAPYEDDYAIAIEPFIEAAREYDNAENDGWVVLLDHIINKVNADGTSSTYTHMAAKVLTDAGVKRFDRYFPQAWGNQAVKMKTARVIKADGSIVDAKTQTFGDFRMVDFPPLVAGDIVDVEFRADERQQSFFGDYFGNVNYFADQVPMLHSKYVLITPTERDFFLNTKNIEIQPVEELKDDGATRVQTWTVENAPKIRAEQGMPARRESFPQVQVTTYESWDAFSKWWWSMIRDQHIASDSIKEKVAELVEGVDSRRGKIAAIYKFITDDIEYQAWSFGVHGYKPYTTTSIFEKKEGDCKDVSILMNTMLREVGIEAFPVLVMRERARSEEDFSLAMVQHFNHCITFVPDYDGNGTPLYLDGTNQYSHIDFTDGTDRGGKVLIVKPDGGEISQIPLGTVDDTGIDQDWTVTVNADGSAQVKGSIKFRGDIAMMIRRRFSIEGQRALMLNGILAGTFGKVKLGEFDFDDLADYSEPFESVRLTFDVERFVKGSGEVRELPSEFLQFMGDVTGMVRRPEREHDLILQTPVSMRLNVQYVLPEGWSLEAAPEDVDLQMDEAAFTSAATSDGAKLTLARNLELRGTRIKKERYAEFREGLIRASTVSKQAWKVRPGDAEANDEAE